jgi:ribokinase
MMDLVARASRRPAPGETLLGESFEMFLGGKGFNQAVAAARAGAATAMVGRVGDDEFGGRFLAALEREGVDASCVRRDAALGTGVGLPLVEASGANSIVVVPRANRRVGEEDVRAARPWIEAARVLLLQLELPEETALAAARLARGAGRTVLLNPAPAGERGLGAFAGLVDCVIPNEGEAERLTGVRCEDEDGVRAAVRALADQTGARGVVLTLGERGAVVACEGRLEHVAPHAVPCVDSVGAGDAFCGALAARLALGAPLGEAVRWGNAAGALAVTRAGAEPSMPRAGETRALLEAASSPRA